METEKLHECWNRIEQESNTLIHFKNQLHDTVINRKEEALYFMVDSLLDSISNLRRYVTELEQCYTEHL